MVGPRSDGDFAMSIGMGGGRIRKGASVVEKKKTAKPESYMETTKRPRPKVKFKRTGKGREDGELKAKVGRRTITISKSFDHNIKHTGEWKLHVDGEWHNTYPSLRSAKAAATALPQEWRK